MFAFFKKEEEKEKKVENKINGGEKISSPPKNISSLGSKILKEYEKLVKDELYKKFKKNYSEEEALKKAQEAWALAKKKQREEKDKHVLITLDRLNYITVNESYELIKKLVENLKLENVQVGTIVDLEVKEDEHGRKKVYYKDKEVEVVFFPSPDKKDQFVVPYYEYTTLVEKNEWEAVEGLKLFIDMVKKAISLKTSDIHIIPKILSSGTTYYVYFRINKELRRMDEYLMNEERGKMLIKAVMLRANQETKGNFRADETKVYQDARISFNDLKVDLRLAFIPDGKTLEHLELVARIIKRQEIRGDVPLREKLKKYNYDDKVIEVWENAIKARGKIIVISGITNSGKSTLMVNLISSLPEKKKVETVEDPIEAVVLNPNVSQHQVYIPKQEELKMDFTKYGKSFKRADPDVVVIGEWREDPALTETIKSMAYAGQLVFTTTHIASAYQIYEALRDVYKVDEKTTASFLLLSFNQALIPRLCEHCKKKVIVDDVYKVFSDTEIKLMPFSDFEKEEILRILKEYLEKYGKIVYYERGSGCEKCKGSGINGLYPVYEYFINSQEIKEAVIKNKLSPDELKKFAVEKGYGTLKVHRFLYLFLKGEVEKDAIFNI